jgi:dTDP-glucose 4,6-dehydratase
MKHVIVGGNGMVGRHLAGELLQRGEDVVVVDVAKTALDIYRDVGFVNVDVAVPSAATKLPFGADDVVYNLSAQMLGAPRRRHHRREHYWPVNYYGTFHILEAMLIAGASQLVHFSTDLVYGRGRGVALTEQDAPAPIGEYGASKLASEELAARYREFGMGVTIFRPRRIVGPGRHGFLSRLFNLIERNLPVPVFGSGHNPYQFVSAFDCAAAAVDAWTAGCPNEVYNLGSDDPPPQLEILRRVIREADSSSFPISIPAAPVKLALGLLDRINLPLKEPERYLVADLPPILDASKAKRELGWRPAFSDIDLAVDAYREYRATQARPAAGPVVLPAE